MRRLVATLVAVGAIGCAVEPIEDETYDFDGDGKADGPGSDATYVSSASIAALRSAEKVARLQPAFAETFPNDPIEAWEYLKPLGPLGPFGPLGPYGPLGRSGPVGFRVVNPSSNIELVGAQIEAYAAWLDAVRAWYTGLAQWGDVSWRAWSLHLESIAALLRSWRFESRILSAEGPLASTGPLAPDRWDGRRFMDELGMPDAPATDLIPQMGPGGVLTALGPIGPLGALGPLGPLGPTTPLITFQGYQPDTDGQYVSGLNGCFRPADARERTSHLCRTLLVPWKKQDSECSKETTNCRRYELYENYSESFAKQMPDNDTSFMVAGETAEGEEDAYTFASRDAQFVTIVVAPEEKPLADLTALQGLQIAAGYMPGNLLFTRAMKYMPEALETYPGAWATFYDHETAFDDFDLAVEFLDARGTVTKVAHARTTGHYGMPDWVQLRVPAGTKLRATVTLRHRRVGILGNPEAFTLPQARYRLFVTGSTKHAPAVSTRGPQFSPLTAR